MTKLPWIVLAGVAFALGCWFSALQQREREDRILIRQLADNQKAEAEFFKLLGVRR